MKKGKIAVVCSILALLIVLGLFLSTLSGFFTPTGQSKYCDEFYQHYKKGSCPTELHWHYCTTGERVEIWIYKPGDYEEYYLTDIELGRPAHAWKHYKEDATGSDYTMPVYLNFDIVGSYRTLWWIDAMYVNQGISGSGQSFKVAPLEPHYTLNYFDVPLSVNEGDSVYVSFSITNDGDKSGTPTMQLYNAQYFSLFRATASIGIGQTYSSPSIEIADIHEDLSLTLSVDDVNWVREITCIPYVAHDTDGDGISDSNDNCPNIYNPNQADDDNDGIGNTCDPDWNNNNVDPGLSSTTLIITIIIIACIIFGVLVWMGKRGKR